ncbi:MAG: hypothetical protein IT173_00295 [Acidobacteria bacterium]|nr:hypothetical protein [Acidobacteriota bacterium]
MKMTCDRRVFSISPQDQAARLTIASLFILPNKWGIPLITSDGKLLTPFPYIAVAMEVFIS